MNTEQTSKPETKLKQVFETGNEAQIRQIQAAKKDKSAFYPLYLKFVDRIYYYILARVGSHQDAEDLSSEVFIRAMSKLHRFDERNSFAAWLFKIARNLTIDHYRANKVIWLDVEEFDLPATENGLDPETVIVLREQLTKLEAREFDLLSLRYAAGLTFVEMGQILGKSPGAVRKAHSKVLKCLRLNME